MSHPLIRACDNYVVMEPGQKERFLNKEETLQWLESWLTKMNELPQDLRKYASNTAAAQRLLDTACDLEINAGFNIQWFAIRPNPDEV